MCVELRGVIASDLVGCALGWLRERRHYAFLIGANDRDRFG